ncbi:MAG: nitrite/sulfite reductase [Phycisphaerales bacterium]|nr:nitrite/sulfite reductase [Phycisphaerales bacterium]
MSQDQETSDSKPAAAELEIPTWDVVLKRNSIERLKNERAPHEIINDLSRLIDTGYEAIPEEDIVRLQWWGLYHDKPKTGGFMLRVKIAGGLLTAPQFRVIGQLANKHGLGHGEITTRQDVQLHSLRLESLPDVYQTLKEAGLTAAGGCGDVLRNITGCPVAGIEKNETFDVRDTLHGVADYFYGNPRYTNLPRKHKYTISACPHQCNAPEINCVGLIGVIKDGREGFAVTIGGGLSAQPRLARDMETFIPKEQARELLEAITGCWMDNLRYRRSRAKARFKFMVDDYGAEAIREMVEKKLGRSLERLTAPHPVKHSSHLGINPQRQEGLSYVGFPVPLGWVNGDQMQAIADVAEDVGGDVRMTQQQNFIIANIPNDRVDEVVQRIEKIGFSLKTNGLYGNSIGCTGEPFCNYAVALTKDKLKEILDALDKRFGRHVNDLRVHLDGCPHACAQHFTGDINLTGTTVRLPGGGKMEGYDILLRGGVGEHKAIARPVFRRVRTDEVVGYVERLVAAWLEAKGRAETEDRNLSFRDFCEEHTDEQLQELISHEAASATTWAAGL